MFSEATHREPVIRFATKKGRRMFLLVGSLSFVIFSALIILIGLVLMLDESAAQPGPWFMLIVGIVGLLFFGVIALGVGKNHWGSQGDTSLIMSPSGVTDRTQIIGPLNMIPWELIVQYDLVFHHGHPFLLLQLRDPQAYLQIIGSSRIMRFALKANSKIYGAPVHAIALDHIQGRDTDILGAMFYLTGLPPGHQASPDNNQSNI